MVIKVFAHIRYTKFSPLKILDIFDKFSNNSVPTEISECLTEILTYICLTGAFGISFVLIFYISKAKKFDCRTKINMADKNEFAN